MVSIRVWLDSERIITTRHRRLQSTQMIRDELLVGTGPKDQAEFLEIQNSKMFLLSLVAAVFLPLSFITGMMGMNTAGLPGSENTMALWIVVVLMLLTGLGIILVFRRKRWM